MRKLNRLTMTLALLIMAVGGAWADETLLLTIENKDYTTFKSGSKTFDDKVTVTFSNSVYNDGDGYGWYAGGTASLLTVAGINGYTITSCKFYTDMGTAVNGYTVEGESPSVYLYDDNVYTDASESVNIGSSGIKKIEVYTAEPEITEWELKPDETGKKWILADMPASNVELQVEYEPTKVTMAVNDKTMGTVEAGGESKVEWTPDTWKDWPDYNAAAGNEFSKTVGNITLYRPSGDGWICRNEGNLNFFIKEKNDDLTCTFSTTGAPFSCIEFTMTSDYNPGNGQGFNGYPNIQPADGWTFEGKSAVWEGEATKSLTLQSCTTMVSKITFFKGGVPDGVTVNGDGTFTVAKTATVTLTATPAEGYKFLYWEDDHSNTNPVREVTIESGMDDMTYKAVFAEILYNVTFVEGTDLNEWTATPNTAAKNTQVDIKYNGAKKVIGVKVAKKSAYLKWDAGQKKLVETAIPTTATKVTSSTTDVTWQAGTYVVEGEVTINGTIFLGGNVDLIIKDGAKLTANHIHGGINKYNLSIYGQASQTGQLVVNYSDNDAILYITTLEVHSCQVKATSSGENSAGFYGMTTFNVYGGSVDAEYTGTQGDGIKLTNNGSMNIYGGEVKAVGKGTKCGITCVSESSVTVYGGKLWAENADNAAIDSDEITLTKGAGFSGKIETSDNGSSWTQYNDDATPGTKYVRVGY